MFNSQPPSWYPDEASRERVDAARGTVLDALGGLRNLEKLSGSMRVGPRSLSSVLPDVLASCEPLRSGLDALFLAVETQRLDTRGALEQLRNHSQPCLSELKEILSYSEKQPMQARNRLKLQQTVGRIARELGATAELVDFLGMCVWSRPMTVTMQDLMLEAFRANEPTGDLNELRKVELQQTTGEVELHVRPRAVIPMLVLLVRVMLRRHPTATPFVVLEPESQGISRISISASGDKGESRWILNRPVIPAAKECLETAARALDVRLEISDDLDYMAAAFSVSPLNQL
jgi:hypothetical protein